MVPKGGSGELSQKSSRPFGNNRSPADVAGKVPERVQVGLKELLARKCRRKVLEGSG